METTEPQPDLFGLDQGNHSPKSRKTKKSPRRPTWLDEMRAQAESRTADLRVISFGAGVQSTTLLLMMLRGEIRPRADCAIFADTGWEPRAVYYHLAWIQGVCRKAGFPLYLVSAGNIRADIEQKGLRGRRFASMPLYVYNQAGERALLRRQCTREYKITPIEQKIRDLLGYEPRKVVKETVEQWLGISLDEMERMRESRTPWCVNRYPLIEKRMTRRMCLKWLEKQGYPRPPKSSCIGCPFHDDVYWRSLKTESPGEWEDAVAFDRLIRTGHGLKGVNSPAAYVHRSMVPLEEVKLLSAEELGQLSAFRTDRRSEIVVQSDEAETLGAGMLMECEGYCGT